MAKTKSSHTDKFADEMVDTIVSIVEKYGLLVGGGIRKVSDGVYKINFVTQSKEHDKIRPSSKGTKKSRIST